jgi:hypothetical protein
MRTLPAVLLAVVVLSGSSARAGFTETLPEGTFMLDSSVSFATLRHRYDNDGQKTTLIDPMVRYEPGGGLQGVLIPNAEVNILILINQLQYGIRDNLCVGIGIPVVLSTTVDLDLQWIEGDYQPYLGRSYTGQDFWDWAGSMGQPKPEDWTGNQGVLSDIVLALRYRFSDDIPALRKRGLKLGVMIMGALPTGSPPPEEEIAAAGTTMWDLHTQGELCFHFSMEREFLQRITLGIDLFYEFFFPRTYDTPEGTKHPLLLRARPYVGDTYTLDPGDFAGVAIQLEVVAIEGPALATWLSDHDAGVAEKFPPLLKLSLQYQYTHVGQSDWESDSEIWDWDKEKLWLPGHKNTLCARASISLLRLGVPAQLYFTYRNQSWLSGQNIRAADVIAGGIQVPAKFW